jgi:carbamoyltransferase
MPVVTLGIWDGHDSGCALVDQGRLVSAVNEERLTRRKLEVCFPSQSLRVCLSIAGLVPSDVDVVAACTTDPAKTLGRWFPSFKESYYQVRRRKAAPGWLTSIKKRAKYWMTEWGPNTLTHHLSAIALRHEMTRLGLGGAALRLFDHHSCHAAAAAAASGYATCAVVTLDGVGDGLSSTVSAFADGKLTRIAESHARDSLGIFFEHVTNLLNMRELEDEGKVMALADYAAPVPDGQNPLLELFSVRDGRIRASVPGHSMMSRLRSTQWRFPNEQFAQMAQRTVEDVCVRLARDAVRLAGVNRVALAGGVASNVKANRQIRLLPEVEELFVFPHMGDGGLAAGAAIVAASSAGALGCDCSRIGLGPCYSDEEIVRSIAHVQLASVQPPALADRVAQLIAEGAIVMWFQGRMEYGPRALGHRSVLARPDRADIRDRLNLVLKQRVYYQPFCPSILESDAARVLSDYSGRANRHMTMAYMVAPPFRGSLAGVTSVDGSCRPQIVADDDGGRFAELLRAVRAQSGLGAVLNTSLNIHGEPLVCTPQEAIDVYLRTGADALVIGSSLCVRAANG